MSWFSFFRARKEKYHSKINGEITVTTVHGNSTLFVSDIPQSGGELKGMWKAVIKKLFKSKFAVGRCLLLGIGGGDIVKILRFYYPFVSILGVDIDPFIVQLAKKYFHIKRSDFNKLIISDAVSWVKEYQHYEAFDMIVVDLFIGRFNPEGARTKEFLQNIKKLKSNSGIVLFNSHYQESNTVEFEEFQKLCLTVFSKAEEVFRFRRNRVLLLA